MPTVVQGTDMDLYVRDYGTTQNFKRLTCLGNLSFKMHNDVSKKNTRCGIYKGVQITDMDVAGDGAQNILPSASEYSYDDLQVDQQNRTKKEFRIQDAATLGSEKSFCTGGGYFVDSEGTWNVGDTANFTFTLTVDGPVIFSES